LYALSNKNGFSFWADFRGVERRAKSVALGIALFWSNVVGAQTLAGAQISNTAELRYGISGVLHVVRSNRVDLTTAERLDVGLSVQGNAPIRSDGTGGYIAALVLQNLGNGEEAFSLQASLNRPDYSVRAIAIDSDGDGRYDPAHDQLVTNGVSPVLQPGQTLSLLVLIDAATPTANPDGMTLSVVTGAQTGTGPTGTVFPGKGDGGGDAVVGATGASAQVALPFVTNSASAPSFIKTQSVRAPDGSSRAVRDAVVTYTMTATFTAPATGALVSDVIPVGTTYVPGSLRLDAAPLSDAADADAGAFDGNSIRVALGDVAGAGSRSVQFQVKIK
jgi:uncharacterized repeat protein (TIGR01451 family)